MCQCECTPQKIKNPAQIELVFPVDHESESYKRGYETGLEWDANWFPGGPFVCRPNRQGVDTLYEKQKKENEDYLAGFKRGLDLRLKENDHFNTWWHANRGGHKRYVAVSCN